MTENANGNGYMTPAELLNIAEDVEEIVAESADYTSYELLEPGEYVSPAREIFVSKRVAKNNTPFISAEIRVTELHNADGEVITLARPLRTWVNSLQFGKKNRPGTTSSVSDYLKACGFDAKSFSGGQVIEALGESAQLPVKVRLEWTNQTSKLADGSYEPEVAYTSDFNQGTKEEPKFVAMIDPRNLNEKQHERLEPILKDGEFIKARHRIGMRFDSGFRKV